MAARFQDHQGAVGSFTLTVDGVEIGTFKEVHGLQIDVSVETFEEGGQNGFQHRFPGRLTWPNITFRRGLTNPDNLFSWINQVAGDGFAANGHKLERSTGAITLYGTDLTRLRSWNIEGAFPVRWTGPDLTSEGGGALSEELEIAHHGFRAESH